MDIYLARQIRFLCTASDCLDITVMISPDTRVSCCTNHSIKYTHNYIFLRKVKIMLSDITLA